MYREILKFWFEEIEPSQWWKKDENLDRLITKRFSEIHRRATRCELFEWRKDAHGRLAEGIVARSVFAEHVQELSPVICP